MIGFVRRCLLELVEAEGGPDARRRILAAADLDDAPVRIDHAYDDAATRRLFEAAAETLGLTLDELCAREAEHFLGECERHFPAFFRMATNARDFLLRQPRVHACLAAGLSDPGRGAVAAKLRIEEQPGALLTHYASPARLARRHVALTRVALRRFGETGSVEALDDLDSPACRILTRWAA